MIKHFLNRKKKLPLTGNDPEVLAASEAVIASEDRNKQNRLVLKRACGEEMYPILCAKWSILKGDGTWDDPYALCLDMEFGEKLGGNQETDILQAKPKWEVSFFSLLLKPEDLQAGLLLKFENTDGEADANFYYQEHQPTFDNSMKILEVDGDNFLIRVQAKMMDIHYYDGTKPQNELLTTAWFQKKQSNSK